MCVRVCELGLDSKGLGAFRDLRALRRAEGGARVFARISSQEENVGKLNVACDKESQSVLVGWWW